MDERVASVVGLIIAVFIVVVAMNKHIIEEIIDDLRGVTSTRRPSQNQPSVEWTGGSPGRGEGSSGGGAGASSTDSLSSSSGAGVAEPRFGVIIEPRTVERSSSGAGNRTKENHTEVNTSEGMDRRREKVATDGQGVAGLDGEGEESLSREEPADLPAIETTNAEALALLRCQEGAARLWVVGLTPNAQEFQVDHEFEGELIRRLDLLPFIPRRIAVTWQGCENEQVEQLQSLLTSLCRGPLVGVPVVDLSTGRRLPMCGI